MPKRSSEAYEFKSVLVGANECRKDGLKSTYAENVRVQKGDRKLRHLRMVDAKLIEFAGNFTLRLYKTPMT